ncbi:tumor necrosis factor receptor superfamily member 6 isoform X1 [Meriones unguiculatus]|uniref:tumor necrosis factor receptor superfamily member 6 isoform X1 n=1 Tax=Meriones unguiculatus TaxID=10047 RepID=UPI000B4F3E22|nr:tumor necrosis factor receptor superfamily member 6 isoform X1 [Meriones unguiculatus]
MLWIWAGLPLVLAGSQLSVLTQDNDSFSVALELRRNVREIDTGCPEGLYRDGEFCCQPCQPGERKHSSCTGSGSKPICQSCTEGKDYMDKKHYSDKCRRCALCDGGHGLEVEANCTPTQNTKCRCKEGFYCDTSVCEHCEVCVSCEHGVLEECTRTSNTKCKGKGPSSLLWLLLLIIPVLVIPFVLYKKYWRRSHDDPESETSKPENVPMNFGDDNLSKYLPIIAEQMTINQVKTFARVNKIPETKIDEIKNDHIGDTAEQKIQLLQCWYQSHGKKDAYHAFVKGLKKAHCCTVAERFQAIVRQDSEHSV